METQGRPERGPAATIPAGAWYALAILLLANAINYLDRMIVALLIEPIRESFQLTDTQIGLLIGATFAFVFTLASLPVGRIVDQYDRRRVIAIGCAIWSTAAVALGFARSFGHLLVARMGVAIGEAALTPSAISLISDLFPKRAMGRAMAIFGIGGVAGAGFAYLAGAAILALVNSSPAITLPLYGQVASWQATLIFTGLISFIVVALIFTFPEPARKGVVARQEVSTRSTLKFLRRHWTYFVPHFLGFALLQMFVYSLTSWIPAFLTRAYAMPPEEIGIVYGAMWLVLGVAGALAGGVMADLLSARGKDRGAIWLIVAVSLVLWPLATLYPLVESRGLSLVLIAAMTFATCIPVGLSNLLLQQVTPNQMRGQMVAITTFAVNLIAFGVGPTGVGILSDALGGGLEGLRWALAAVASICCPAAALIFVFAGKGFGPLRRQAEHWQ